MGLWRAGPIQYEEGCEVWSPEAPVRKRVCQNCGDAEHLVEGVMMVILYSQHNEIQNHRGNIPLSVSVMELAELIEVGISTVNVGSSI